MSDLLARARATTYQRQIDISYYHLTVLACGTVHYFVTVAQLLFLGHSELQEADDTFCFDKCIDAIFYFARCIDDSFVLLDPIGLVSRLNGLLWYALKG